MATRSAASKAMLLHAPLTADLPRQGTRFVGEREDELDALARALAAQTRRGAAARSGTRSRVRRRAPPTYRPLPAFDRVIGRSELDSLLSQPSPRLVYVCVIVVWLAPHPDGGVQVTVELHHGLFCGNDGVNGIDYLGFKKEKKKKKAPPPPPPITPPDTVVLAPFQVTTTYLNYPGYQSGSQYPFLAPAWLYNPVFDTEGFVTGWTNVRNTPAVELPPFKVSPPPRLAPNSGGEFYPDGSPMKYGKSGTPYVVAPNSPAGDLVMNAGRNETGVRTTTGDTKADEKADGTRGRGNQDGQLTPPTPTAPVPEPTPNPLGGLYPDNGQPHLGIPKNPGGLPPFTSPPKDLAPYGGARPPPPGSNWNRPEPKVVLGVAAGVGTGYLIYRGVRMVPSLFPPLWWTIPANAAMP